MTAENRALVRSAPKQLGKRFIGVCINIVQTMIGKAAYPFDLRGCIPVAHALFSPDDARF